MLKFETKQVIQVQDWDDLVRTTYGKPYDFQQQEGCQDRGSHHLRVPDGADDFKNESLPYVINGDEMGVSFASWLATDHKIYRDIFWERNFYPGIQMIANDLHAKGLIPSGEYIIEIDW